VITYETRLDPARPAKAQARARGHRADLRQGPGVSDRRDRRSKRQGGREAPQEAPCARHRPSGALRRAPGV